MVPGAATLPAPVLGAVEDLLARVDRALPGRVEGFYVVGSACLGAFRLGRSDVDFVAVVDRELGVAELGRLRAAHRGQWCAALVRDAGLRRRWPLVCNGSYLQWADLSRSPSNVTPVAGHVAGHFGVGGRDFDVNPVTWTTLARHGIAVRGPDRNRLDIYTDTFELRAWTLENLNGYWRLWAERARGPRPGLTARALPRHFAASAVLGVSRLPYAVATGQIASKEGAGEYALEAFDPRWREIITEALAYWRAESPARTGGRRGRLATAADFVDYVADFTARSV